METTPKKTISLGMHYATMVALIVSNLCTLGLAMLFAGAYGQGIGLATFQIENKAHAATPISGVQAKNYSGSVSLLPIQPVSFSAVDSSLDHIAMARGLDGFSIFAYWQQTAQPSTSTPTSTQTINNLKFAKCLDRACRQSVKVTLTTGDELNTYPSLDIASGATSTPTIAYVPSYNGGSAGSLNIVHCLDSACSSVTAFAWAVGASNSYPISLAIGPNNIPGVVFVSTGGNIKFAKCTTVNCSTSPIVTTITASSDNRNPSVAFNSIGLPVISYHDAGSHSLKLAVCSNAFCSSATITTLYSAAYTNGFPITSSVDFVTPTSTPTLKTPIISFNAPYSSSLSALHNLRVAACKNPSCADFSVNVVDWDGYNGVYNSIRTNPATGFPVISYLDFNTSNLSAFVPIPDDVKFAACTDWQCTASTKVVIAEANDAYLLPFGVEIVGDGKPLLAIYRQKFGDDGIATLEAAKCVQNNCQ